MENYQKVSQLLDFPGGASGKKKKKKNTQGDLRNLRGAVLIPGQEDPLKEGMATHSSILAWRMPCTEEPGGLQSTRSQRVRHN